MGFYELLRLLNILLLSLFAWATSFEKVLKIASDKYLSPLTICEEQNNLEQYHGMRS